MTRSVICLAWILSVLASMVDDDVYSLRSELVQLGEQIRLSSRKVEDEAMFDSIGLLSKTIVKPTWKKTANAIQTAGEVSNYSHMADRFLAEFKRVLQLVTSKFKYCVSAAKKQKTSDCLLGPSPTEALESHKRDIADMLQLNDEFLEDLKLAMGTFWFFQKRSDLYKKLKAAYESALLIFKRFTQ